MELYLHTEENERERVYCAPNELQQIHIGGVEKLSQSDLSNRNCEAKTYRGDENKPIRYFKHKQLPGACVRIGLNTSPTLDPKLAAE
jgi:hypothetical protein